ncbi:hypothetical protein M408DRAFT_330663 [Serendipita vermifera MAFF 305830]|uniref:Uncharacterized protein n=1 Tax=Serendipita vermifera MAFF 305830 TaxID=933852 RepID=A0A0C2XAS3_SERVB|nr:hypothetical protein M408DRAFT_330663 [Serendipita vermifera MAFF 305830]
MALAGSTLVAATAAGPADIVVRSPGSGTVQAMAIKRQESVEAQVSSILTTLRSDIASPLASIKSMIAAGDVSLEEITPHFEAVTGSLTSAAGSITAISPVSLPKLLARQTNDELANLIAGIINDIADALQGLVGDLKTIRLLSGLLFGLDTALNQVLVGLGILLKGVLNLVAQLLVNVAALLRNLAFGLSLGTLGL